MKRRCVLAAGILAWASSLTWGATLTWGPAGGGGSGTWSTTTANWYDGSNTVPWAEGSSAIFGGTAGTATISGTVTAQSLQFLVGGYTVAGGTLNGSTSGLALDAEGDVTFTSNVYSNVSSPSAGVFTKTGAGTATFSTLLFFNQVNVMGGGLSAATSSAVSSALYYFSTTTPTSLTLGGYVNDGFFATGLQGGNSTTQIYALDSTLSGTSGLRTFEVGGTNASFAGVLRDNGANVLALSKYQASVQELTGVNTYSGATNILAGTLSLAGAGSALNTVFSVTAGATLLLDNTAQALSNRVGDTAAISLSGTLLLKGNAQAPVTETVGAVTLRGLPLILVVADPAQPATLVLGGLSTASGLPVFAGTNLGAAAGPGVASIQLAAAPSLTGGGGAAGSTTQSIIAGAYGGTNGAESLVTYGSNGVRPLTDAEYVHNAFAGGAAANVSLEAPVAVSGTVSANALRVAPGGALTGSGTLSIASGTILSTADRATLAAGTLDFAGVPALIFSTGELDLPAAVIHASRLSKAGPGTLVLIGTNSYSGATSVFNGTLELASSAALGASTSVSVASAGTLVLAGGVAIGGVPLGLNGTLQSLPGQSSWAGSVAAGSFNVAAAGTLTLSGKVSGDITKFGSGTLVFSGDTGAVSQTALYNGTLRSTVTVNPAGPFSHAPLGDTLTLYGGNLQVAPSGSGAAIAIGLGPSSLNYAGAALLTLDRGQNTSLTVSAGRFQASTVSGPPTLVIATAGGALGSVEKILGNSFLSSFQGPAIVNQQPDGTATYLSYSTPSAGLVPATPASGTIQTAGSTAFYRADTPQSLTASATLLALQDQGQTIDLSTFTLTLGRSFGTAGGLILNGGIITDGTLTAPSGAFIYTAAAGGTISSTVTILPVFPPYTGFTFFGPGTLTYSGRSMTLTGSLQSNYLNSGTLRLEGSLNGSLNLQPGATFAGTGTLTGTAAGGVISPGDTGPGILTARGIAPGTASPLLTAQVSNTAFAFEFEQSGLPVFNQPGESANDLLRLTDSFTSALTSSNVISLYLGVGPLTPGETFFGGFATDIAADFSSSIDGATFQFYLADPAGPVQFDGQSYDPLDGSGFVVSTVPVTADYGSGPATVEIMELQVVPEPGLDTLLALAAATLAMSGRRLARRR